MMTDVGTSQSMSVEMIRMMHWMNLLAAPTMLSNLAWNLLRYDKYMINMQNSMEQNMRGKIFLV